MSRIVTFGEIMLRLKAPDGERLLQSPILEATFGGGEANVAVGLSHLDLNVSYLSVVPNNPLGDACIAELKKHGVDTSLIIRGGNRLGIYFLENGSNQRSSKVLYDRSYSGVSELKAGDVNWERVFQGATWFHITGITPALSLSTSQVAIEAVREAKKRNIIVSCDLNYRKKLWNYGKDAREVMGEIIGYGDIAIGNEEDFQKSLGIVQDIDVESGKLQVDSYKILTKRILSEFPNLKKVAVTMRSSHSADYNTWEAVLNNREGFMVSKRYEIYDIVDRVGSGDAFAAGLIYGFSTFKDDRESLEFATACGCLQHTYKGDFPLFSVNEVKELTAGKGSGRIER